MELINDRYVDPVTVFGPLTEGELDPVLHGQLPQKATRFNYYGANLRAPVPKSAESKLLLLSTTDDFGGRGRIVCFIDGRITWLTSREFEESRRTSEIEQKSLLVQSWGSGAIPAHRIGRHIGA